MIKKPHPFRKNSYHLTFGNGHVWSVVDMNEIVKFAKLEPGIFGYNVEAMNLETGGIFRGVTMEEVIHQVEEFEAI